MGRDVLSRLLWGARGSLAIAAGSASLACLLGTILGLAGVLLPGVLGPIAGYGLAIVLCFPPVLLALLIVTLAGPGAATLVPALALLNMPGFAHVLRNALMPVLTVFARYLGPLLGATVLVEYVFNYPGLLGPLIEAAKARDYPMVAGIVLAGTVLFVVLNLAIELLNAALDPRVGAV